MHWTHTQTHPTVRRMRAHDVRSGEPLFHGAYLCLAGQIPAVAVDAIAADLGLRNEFLPGDGAAAEIYGLVRRVTAAAAAIPDERLMRTEALVHVASAEPGRVDAFVGRIRDALGGHCEQHVLRGVVPPPTYTGNAMHNFAYAHRMLQQPGPDAPNAFLLPLRKTAAWWRKDWMERHTYFLPRYDEHDRMVREGHALAAEAGVAALLRRTYKAPELPAPDGGYEFVNYFECADDAVATFHAVCHALRDTARNPEWRFVEEGPLWQGRRVATWAELAA